VFCGVFAGIASQATLGKLAKLLGRGLQVCFRWSDDGPEDVEVVDYH